MESIKNEKKEPCKIDLDDKHNSQIFTLFDPIILDDIERKILRMIIENKDPEYILNCLINEEKYYD